MIKKCCLSTDYDGSFYGNVDVDPDNKIKGDCIECFKKRAKVFIGYIEKDAEYKKYLISNDVTDIFILVTLIVTSVISASIIGLCLTNNFFQIVSFIKSKK